MRSKNYAINEKPYELNIVGVRNAQSQPNKFDDSIFVFYKDDKNKWVEKEYPATTDTGMFYLLNPISNLGSVQSSCLPSVSLAFCHLYRQKP